MHRHPRDIHLPEILEDLPQPVTGGTAHATGDHEDLRTDELALDDLAQSSWFTVEYADPVHVRAGLPAGRGECVGVDVVDLAESRVAVDVDEFRSEGQHRDPRPRVHEDLRAADGGKQSDLGGADDGTVLDDDVAGLHVRAGTVDELAGADPVERFDAASCLGRPVQRQDSIRQCRQRGTGLHADSLTRLQAHGTVGTGGDFTDHREHRGGRVVGVPGRGSCTGSAAEDLADVDRADGEPVDGGLVEAGEKGLRLDLFSAPEAQSLGNRGTHRLRGDCRSGHRRQLLLNALHGPRTFLWPTLFRWTVRPPSAPS